MIPIGDDNSDRSIAPFVNYILIALNVLVFLVFQGAGSNEHFTYAYSTVPAEIIDGRDYTTEILQPTPVPVYFTLLTSMFMHGGWAHLLGNMLYLWIFGDNIENRLGHIRYLIFYLLCGILASLSHVFATYAWSPGSMLIPSLGASGAISGVLGAYILLYPKNKVSALFLRSVVQVPSWVALGVWILFQIISGVGALGDETGGGGVAYAAHIGGFLAGLILVKIFDPGVREVTTRKGFF